MTKQTAIQLIHVIKLLQAYGYGVDTQKNNFIQREICYPIMMAVREEIDCCQLQIEEAIKRGLLASKIYEKLISDTKELQVAE